MRHDIKLLIVVAALLASQPAYAAPEAKADPCSLITTAEIEKDFGKLREPAKSDTNGSHPGEVRCNFTNESGAWLTISIYKPTGWGMEKGLMPNEQTPIAGLGDEAFSTKRGSDSEVYIRKGEKILYISTSGGMVAAKAVAKKAFARWK